MTIKKSQPNKKSQSPQALAIDANIEDKPQSKSSKVKLQGEPQTMDELIAQTGRINLGAKKGDIVNGVVVSVSPKEIFVDIGKKSFGIVAEWELEQVKDYAAALHVGDKVSAQVMNPESDLGYIVLSLRKSSAERRWAILSEKKENGEDIEAVGLEMAKGGLLVEWQNLRGFIPATQIDHAYSNNPSSLIGKTIKVKVLEVDQSTNRLVLSQKASVLGMSPSVIKEKLSKVKSDDVLKGTVSGIAPFGLFVDIDGLEGLVHISEIAWEKVDNPARFFKVGDTVEVVVLDVNQNEGKLNLSIKRLTPDPWKNILDRFPRDEMISGKVVRMAPYGAFVQLETGIQGLIHISKIPASCELKVGQDVECLVENVDIAKRKISLTLVPKEKPVGYR